MPAVTAEDLQSKYQKYLDASLQTGAVEFRKALNEIMPRIYNMGFWRDMLTTLEEQPVHKGVYILPEDVASTGVGYDSILSCILDDDPMPLYSMWHDYRRFGEPSTTASATYTSHMAGVIDDGFTSFDDYANDGSGAAIDPARRKYRISPVDSDTKATFLMKRKYVDVSADSHRVFVPNDPSVLKHAFLGKLSEDNADIQRAEYHWQTCQRLLDADLDSYRGGAKPVLQISPNGAGGAIRGMY